MRDPVHEHGVVLLRHLGRASQHRQLGADALRRPALVDDVEERPRKSVLTSDQQSDDLFLGHSFLPE